MSLRMLDFRCPVCLEEILDILVDTEDVKPPLCCGMEMVRFLARPPLVDAREPFKVASLGGPAFTSHREMEKYAKATNQTVMLPKEAATRRHTTTEERLARGRPKLREAVEKSFYRVKHGYVDHPPLLPEKNLKGH